MNISARHLQPGDHINGTVISSKVLTANGGVKFLVTKPYTTESYEILVAGNKLDLVCFNVTLRGDSENPNPRNRALGLPEIVQGPYVAPEPIAIYPEGTHIKDIREFDRGQKVMFKCPQHPGIFMSKDPYSSRWFPSTHDTKLCPQTCKAGIGDYVLVEEYKPTRNG